MKKLLPFVIALPILMSGCSTPEQIAAKKEERAAMEAMKIADAEAKLPAGFEQITGDALTATIADTTITGMSASSPGWNYTIYRSSDGTMRGTSKNGSETSDDTGKWWVEGDRTCSQWKRWVNASVTCSQIYSNGEYKMSILPDGTILDGKELKWTNEPGNAANL